MNAVVAVHSPDAESAPVGVWWLDDDVDYPLHYYVPGYEPFETLGKVAMSAKVADVDWPSFWDQLADRTPYASGNWETYTLPDHAKPVAFLDQLRRIAKV